MDEPDVRVPIDNLVRCKPVRVCPTELTGGSLDGLRGISIQFEDGYDAMFIDIDYAIALRECLMAIDLEDFADGE